MAGSGGFAYAVFGGLGLVIVALLMLGRSYPGSGADVLDWQPTRSTELEIELEEGDIDQMLEAQNQRRRVRGAPERTLEDLEQDVSRDMRELQEIRKRLREGGSDAEGASWPES